MKLRNPPVIAAWLLRQLGSGYQGDSLAGDLFEEYQLGRSRRWYWKQTLAAIGIGQARRLRGAIPEVGAPRLLAFLKRLLTALVMTALTAGTLTWARSEAIHSSAPVVERAGP
jgi:hypothetical protein